MSGTRMKEDLRSLCSLPHLTVVLSWAQLLVDSLGSQ